MGDEPAHGQIAGTAAAELARAWNAHDMRAFASLFHDDAALVNVNGAYAHGRHEIRTQHDAVHAGFFRNSTMTMSAEDSRSPAPGLIVAHMASEVHGDDRAPGQVRRALMTLVIERRNDEWKISAAHNTNVVTPPGP